METYLEKINAPRTIWLSEDATVITQKVVYDVRTNQLIGIVLPFDGNGMPISYSYRAQSIDDIERFMKMPQSTVANTIMAQPIKLKSAPFVLQLFGNDNKFSTNDVLKRWEFTETELKKCVLQGVEFYSELYINISLQNLLFRFGITVLGISSDGDSRLLRSMKIKANLEINPLDINTLFSNSEKLYSQDPTHIGTKLRNRFLNPSICMPLGNNQISVSHLKILLSSVSKDVHEMCKH